MGQQARREPQRGPGKHYRGALSPSPDSVCLEIETSKASRGRKLGEGCPLTTRLEVRGSVVSSPSGVRGGARVENGFYAHFRSEISHLEHHFQHFERRWAPHTSRGPRKLPLPLDRPVGQWVMGRGSNGSPFLDRSHGSWVYTVALDGPADPL